MQNSVSFTLWNLHPRSGHARINLRSQSPHAESRGDNRAMNKERNLLPWIFGGLLLASIAIAITAGSLRMRNPATDPALSSPAASLTVAPPAAPLLAEPAVLSSVAADSSADPALTAADTPGPTTSPAVPSGQIWECTTNGLRTFSNNPCGDKSSLHEVGPINTMAATPEVRYVRANGPDPRYAPAYVDESPYAEDAYSEPAAESNGSSYAVIQGFAYLPRRRTEHHPHRPIHHHPGMPVRRN
jgi:hypothetical protein